MHFDKNKNLVVYEDDNHTCYIPAKQCKIIYTNLKTGKDWYIASPAYEITRKQAAFILANWEG